MSILYLCLQQYRPSFSIIFSFSKATSLICFCIVISILTITPHHMYAQTSPPPPSVQATSSHHWSLSSFLSLSKFESTTFPRLLCLYLHPQNSSSPIHTHMILSPTPGNQFHLSVFIFDILAPCKKFSISVIIRLSLFWNLSSSP